MLLHRVRLR
jgi:hypothetical protein